MTKKRSLESGLHFSGKHLFLVAFATISLILIPIASNAQAEEDTIIEVTTTEKVKKGSIFSGRPGKSFLMSLAIPGAGQIYNKSYLRVPFVWGAVGGMGWLMIKNTQQYHCFREAYIDKIDGVPITVPEYCIGNNDNIPLTNIQVQQLTNASAASIRELRDQANVNRQWAIVGFAVVWLLNGVDAYVDAHLKDFDIDEDLSIDIGPVMDDDPYAPMRVGAFVRF